MKNEEYEIGYKYGYKLGKYQAAYDMSINGFIMIFGKEHEDKRKKIKWLSYHELELLLDEFLEYLSSDKSDRSENTKEERERHKVNILNLLR